MAVGVVTCAVLLLLFLERSATVTSAAVMTIAMQTAMPIERRDTRAAGVDLVLGFEAGRFAAIRPNCVARASSRCR